MTRVTDFAIKWATFNVVFNSMPFAFLFTFYAIQMMFLCAAIVAENVIVSRNNL